MTQRFFEVKSRYDLYSNEKFIETIKRDTVPQKDNLVMLNDIPYRVLDVCYCTYTPEDDDWKVDITLIKE